MKKKINSIFIFLFLSFVIISVFTSSKVLNETISFSISIFFKNVFPSLFPMFIISSILISIGIPTFLGNLFSKINNFLFKTTNYASFVFFMSMITGYPSNAKYVKELIDENLISKKEATKILLYTSFPNPLFIINTVGVLFFNDITIGIKLYISLFLGNILVGILFRDIYLENTKKENYLPFTKNLKQLHDNINKTNIVKTFLNSISSSVMTLLNIFGTITCFLIIISFVNEIISLNELSKNLMTGILEFTSGLKATSLSSLPFNIKVYLSIFFLCFGGLCVHAQILSILDKIKINYGLFLFSRIIHGLLGIIFMFIFL